jgi:hypothetical protein
MICWSNIYISLVSYQNPDSALAYLFEASYQSINHYMRLAHHITILNILIKIVLVLWLTVSVCLTHTSLNTSTPYNIISCNYHYRCHRYDIIEWPSSHLNIYSSRLSPSQVYNTSCFTVVNYLVDTPITSITPVSPLLPLLHTVHYLGFLHCDTSHR